MSDRQLVLEAVQKMPEASSLADILDELEMLDSIREGLAQSERGEGVPHERVTARVDEHIRAPRHSAEATEWRRLMMQTHALTAARGSTDEDIAAEVAAVRACR